MKLLQKFSDWLFSVPNIYPIYEPTPTYGIHIGLIDNTNVKYILDETRTDLFFFRYVLTDNWLLVFELPDQECLDIIKMIAESHFNHTDDIYTFEEQRTVLNHYDNGVPIVDDLKDNPFRHEYAEDFLDGNPR